MPWLSAAFPRTPREHVRNFPTEGLAGQATLPVYFRMSVMDAIRQNTAVFSRGCESYPDDAGLSPCSNIDVHRRRAKRYPQSVSPRNRGRFSHQSVRNPSVRSQWMSDAV